MKWLSGIAAVALALLLLAVFLLMDAIVRRPEVRSVVEELGEAALGRTFHYESLEVGLFPPAVVVVRPVFTGRDDVKAFTAERAEIRIAFLPMLVGDVVVQGIHVAEADIAVVRTDAGVQLAGQPTEPSPEDEGGGTSSSAEIFEDREQAVDEVEESSGAEIAIRQIWIRESTLQYTDHTMEPPITVTFAELHGTARFPDQDSPGPLELRGLLDTGAPVDVEGTLSRDGDGALHIEVGELPVDLLRRFLADGSRIEGSLGLTSDVAFAGWGVTSLSAQLSGEDVQLGVGEASFSGDLPVSVDMKTVDGLLAGTFSLDATQMKLVNSDFFEKPVGDTFALTGRIRLLEGGVELQGDELRAGPAKGRLDLTTEPKFRTVLEAPPFDVAPFLAWFPGLSEVASHGRLGADAFALTFDPFAAAGTITIDGLGLALENGADSRLDGKLVGVGTTIRGDGLVLRVADQPFSASLVVDLAPGGDVELDFLGEDLESGAILEAFGAPPGALTGTGRVDGAFRLPREGEAVFLERLTGQVRAEILDGRWKGVSLLERVLGALSLAAEPLLELGRVEGGSDLQRFYVDDFQSISGTFTVSDGIANTEDLKIEYRTYVVELDGDIRLVDQSLDMTGKLTFFSEVDQAIAGTLGTESAEVSRTIPVAGMKGTLQDPKITLAHDAVRAFAAGVLLSREGEGVKKVLDETLGEGAGDLFEKLIGGDRE